MGNSRVLEWGKDLYVVYRSFLYGLFEMKGHAFFMTCDFAYLSKRIDFALITYIVSEDYRKESMYEYSVYRV